MSYASDALIDALNRENDQLKAENAKLKELLLKSFVLVKNNEPRLVSDGMAKRMRELGIEIDNG